MLDRLIFVVLVLNATDLFRFLAPQFGTSMAQVSLALLCVQGCYLVVRRRHTFRLFRQRDMQCWLAVLLLWPLATVVFSTAIELREIGVQFYYASLFYCVIVYCMSRGLVAMRRLLGVSFAVSLVGIVASMLFPAYFEQTAAVAEARHYFDGRAFGFFMQPNKAALGMTILFLGWHALWQRKTSLAVETALAVLMAAVLMTGSRIGVVVAMILCAIIVAHYWREALASLTQTAYVLRRVAILVAFVGAAIAGAYAFASTGAFSADLTERITSLSHGRLSERDLGEDVSLTTRLEAQASYRVMIWEKPWLGHGLGAESYYRNQGRIRRTSHSTVHRLGMQYGVFYVIAIGLMLVRMYQTRGRARLESLLQTNAVLQCVVITSLTFIIACGVDDSRAFYTVFGMIAAAVYFPECLLQHKYGTKPFLNPRFSPGWSCPAVTGPGGVFGQWGINSYPFKK